MPASRPPATLAWPRLPTPASAGPAASCGRARARDSSGAAGGAGTRRGRRPHKTRDEPTASHPDTLKWFTSHSVNSTSIKKKDHVNRGNGLESRTHSERSLGFKTRAGVCVSSWASRQRGSQLCPRTERSAAPLLGACPLLPASSPATSEPYLGNKRVHGFSASIGTEAQDVGDSSPFPF